MGAQDQGYRAVGRDTGLGAKIPGSGSNFLLDVFTTLDKPFHLGFYLLFHEIGRLD